MVIAIVSILAAMLLPALSRAREMARRVTCASNMKQLLLAIHMYADDNDGWLPPQGMQEVDAGQKDSYARLIGIVYRVTRRLSLMAA